MTNPDYRATPEQWDNIEGSAWGRNPLSNAACLLELRARVEALEAAQRPVSTPCKLPEPVALTDEELLHFQNNYHRRKPMTNPAYRSELQRLVEAYEEHGGKWPDHHEQALFQSVEDARAVLAQPEPVVPTDEELLRLAWSIHGPTFDSDLVDFGRRCYNLAKRPVSLPYKLPEPVVPTDEELLKLMPETMLDEFSYAAKVCSDATGGQVKPGIFRVSLNTGALDYARAVLARWGNYPVKPDSSLANNTGEEI